MGNEKWAGWKKSNTKQLSRRNRNGTLGNKNSNHRLPQTYFFLPAHISLPSFPAAQFSVPLFTGCRFFRCPFPVAVIFDINFLSPFVPTLLFLLPNFQVAQFSNSPNFGSRFYRCPLCRESSRQLLSKLRAHVKQGSQRSQTPPPVLSPGKLRYFKGHKSSPCVRCPATGWYHSAQFIPKPKAACALRFSWAATSSNLGF